MNIQMITIPIPHNDPPYDYYWVEPSNFPGACCVQFISRQQIIDWYGNGGGLHRDADEIVDDFVAVHWATKINHEA